ncbi:MAG: hypothetical protein LBH13_03465 [Cellulomonadaceae bacterium]|jgi:hypothetical protein|nr:hypothetical protein [Cellulomonadaceae bacterium]
MMRVQPVLVRLVSTMLLALFVVGGAALPAASMDIPEGALPSPLPRAGDWGKLTVTKKGGGVTTFSATLVTAVDGEPIDLTTAEGWELARGLDLDIEGHLPTSAVVGSSTSQVTNAAGSTTFTLALGVYIIEELTHAHGFAESFLVTIPFPEEPDNGGVPDWLVIIHAEPKIHGGTQPSPHPSASPEPPSPEPSPGATPEPSVEPSAEPSGVPSPTATPSPHQTMAHGDLPPQEPLDPGMKLFLTGASVVILVGAATVFVAGVVTARKQRGAES